MYDYVAFEDKRWEKSNTYKEIQNADGTVTEIPVTGEIIAVGTPLNKSTFDVFDHGINEAIIMCDLLAVQMIQAQRDLANTYIETGSVTVSTSEEYPFNNATATAALKTKRNTLDYMVIPYCDETVQGRRILVKDRQLNGFKIEVEDCPKAGITVKYYVIGGMYDV
jgi:hypothetical protein